MEFRRDDVPLTCGVDTYVPGETLTAHISSSSGQFIFELDGGNARFETGHCVGLVRKASADGAILRAPTDGSALSLWAAWATRSYGQVSISPTCVLQPRGAGAAPASETTTAAEAATTTTTTGAAQGPPSLVDRGFTREVAIGPDVTLHYARVSSGSVRLAVDAPGTGWAALAVGGTMFDADAVIGGGLKGGGQPDDIRAYRLTSTSGGGVNEDPPATRELSEAEVIHENGRTVVLFTRPLNGGTKAISFDGTTPFLWAYGAGSTINYHAGNRGAVNIDLASGTVDEGTTPLERKLVHGALMMASWGALIPLGTVVAAWGGPHFKVGGRACFHLHCALQSAGLALGVAGAAYAMLRIHAGGLLQVPGHGLVGLAITQVGVLQPMNALLRPSGDGTRRSVWELVHKASGRAATLAGILNCVLGAALACRQHEDEGIFDVYLLASVAVLALFPVAFIVARLRASYRTPVLRSVQEQLGRP